MEHQFICYCLFIIFSYMSQFRGSEIIELKNFSPASVDDIASVHARAYVSGLEKVDGYFPLSFPFSVMHSMFWSYVRGEILESGIGL